MMNELMFEELEVMEEYGVVEAAKDFCVGFAKGVADGAKTVADAVGAIGSVLGLK